jgi:opacity protein-like surface antigen
LKKKHLFIILLFLTVNAHAQDFYISTGKNISNFDYKSSNGSDENLDFRSGLGNNLELGYTSSLKNNRFVYAIGLSYNEFNAEASNYATNYSWETKYLGIINKFSDNLSNTNSEWLSGTGITAFLNIGFVTATLISGKQFINNYYYDLGKHEDFSGILLQPFVGFNTQYNVSRNLRLNLGYNFSKTYNLLNKPTEKISFHTSQFQLGVQVSLLR